MPRCFFCLVMAAVCLSGMALPVSAQGPIDYSRGAGTFPNFSIYQAPEVPEADLNDSATVDKMIREGKLYLSLQDLLLLALENNLDIEVSRYGRLEADADLLRARAGAQLSGVQTQISTLSTGQSAQGSGQQIQG